VPARQPADFVHDACALGVLVLKLEHSRLSPPCAPRAALCRAAFVEAISRLASSRIAAVER
jgi:hypothetical protein